MNFKKVTRNALMSCFFLLMFAIKPGFGKLNLEYHNLDKNKWNRLTEGTILHYKQVNYGFELRCAGAKAEEAPVNAEVNSGFVSTAFIE